MEAKQALVAKYQDMGRTFWNFLPSHFKFFNLLILSMSLLAFFLNLSVLALSPSK